MLTLSADQHTRPNAMARRLCGVGLEEIRSVDAGGAQRETELGRWRMCQFTTRAIIVSIAEVSRVMLAALVLFAAAANRTSAASITLETSAIDTMIALVVN